MGLMLCIGHHATGQNLVIKNAKVISMATAPSPSLSNILIINGRIAFVGEILPHFDSHIQVVDAQGDYVLPGLSDMHVHLPELPDIDSMLANHIAAGVTQIRVMNSTADQASTVIGHVRSNCLIRPKIYYSHIVRKQTKLTEQQADSLMRDVIKNGLSFIKLYGLSDEPTFDALMSASKQHHVTICGHYPRYAQDGKWKYVPMEKVLKSGFKSIEHLAGYDMVDNDSLLEHYISITQQYGVYNCPTLDWDIMAYDLQYPDAYKQRLSYKILPEKWLTAWEQRYKASIEKAGGADKVLKDRDKYLPKFRRKQQVLQMLHKHHCPLILGGDAGNVFQADGFNLYDEMRNWAEAGLDNYSILQAATANAARFFDEQPEWGTVEAGKLANLVLLKKNPLDKIDHIATIYATVAEGKIYYKNQLVR
ncbi:MAG TPA: amidohydrolase family protein [Saprospiraceae bacterium]|nr:amidohydrolase family protein [Saprospiraceae bacterium]